MGKHSIDVKFLRGIQSEFRYAFWFFWKLILYT